FLEVHVMSGIHGGLRPTGSRGVEYRRRAARSTYDASSVPFRGTGSAETESAGSGGFRRCKVSNVKHPREANFARRDAGYGGSGPYPKARRGGSASRGRPLAA